MKYRLSNVLASGHLTYGVADGPRKSVSAHKSPDRGEDASLNSLLRKFLSALNNLCLQLFGCRHFGKLSESTWRYKDVITRRGGWSIRCFVLRCKASNFDKLEEFFFTSSNWFGFNNLVRVNLINVTFPHFT